MGFNNVINAITNTSYKEADTVGLLNIQQMKGNDIMKSYMNIL